MAKMILVQRHPVCPRVANVRTCRVDSGGRDFVLPGFGPPENTTDVLERTWTQKVVNSDYEAIYIYIY